MSWAEQIAGVLYGSRRIQRSDTLVAGYSANTAIGEDIENKPLAIPLSIITKAMKGKDISYSIKRGKIAKLDKGIANAYAVIVNPERSAIVYITDITQGGLPLVVSFDMNATFDGDQVHNQVPVSILITMKSLLRPGVDKQQGICYSIIAPERNKIKILLRSGWVKAY